VACVLADTRNRNPDEDAAFMAVEKIVDETDTSVDSIVTATQTTAAFVHHNNTTTEPPTNKLKQRQMSCFQ
jgi:hypothetical protein